MGGAGQVERWVRLVGGEVGGGGQVERWVGLVGGASGWGWVGEGRGD